MPNFYSMINARFNERRTDANRGDILSSHDKNKIHVHNHARVHTVSYVSVIIEPFWSLCVSREVRTSFSSRKQMATYDFHGEVQTPCPLCLRPYQSFKQFEFTIYFFIIIFFSAGPGQFTKRLLIISAVAKGKDSMILFKIKETAHSNSGHVLF